MGTEKNELTVSNISKLRCLVCQSDSVKKIYSNYPGYVAGTSFDIMKCNNCNTQFILAPSTPAELYNAIYSLECIPGYDRYKRYAKSIPLEKEPLKFLSGQEFAYYAVYMYLKDKKEEVKSILEVGSGLGYLTYALNKSGYQTLGIDISEVSVKNSIDLFGDYYKPISLQKLSEQSQQKFDLIIATELIEHVDDPYEFISECLPLLNEKGVVLLTTPYYYNVNKIWETDLPPIHRFWFSEKSFQSISQRLKLEARFIFPDKGCFDFNHSNLLANYINDRFVSNKLPTPILTNDLRGCVRSNYTNYNSNIFMSVMKKFATFKPVRYFSNKFYLKVINEQPKCFAIILKINL
jgi:SAM-dependent methyltransferase